MYIVTVHSVLEQGREFPLEGPADYRLHSVVTMPPHKFICVWQNVTGENITWTAEATKAWLEAPVAGGA